MRNIVASLIIVCFCGILSAAKPMEVLGHYNVVLVHGAAPENQGFEKNCGNDVIDWADKYFAKRAKFTIFASWKKMMQERMSRAFSKNGRQS